MSIHLRSIDLTVGDAGPDRFPFNLPFVQQFERIEFHSPMVVFAGENGSGKSTLLEALGAAIGLPAVGGSSIALDPTLGPLRDLATAMDLVWSRKTRRGFFLRAEDFFNFTRRMNETRVEMEDLQKDYEGKVGIGWDYARAAIAGQREGVVHRYGEDADGRSHGESFLNLFRSRFVPQGLYLLDEPEAPLSPQRQLALMAMMMEMIEQKSAQFIIATHSPILMGFPDAQIISLDSIPACPVAYDDVEHVSLTRDFLNNRDAFTRHLRG